MSKTKGEDQLKIFGIKYLYFADLGSYPKPSKVAPHNFFTKQTDFATYENWTQTHLSTIHPLKIERSLFLEQVELVFLRG